MALDHYTPCPCGSGKKFKFCCEPIYPGINRAFEQERAGQHETALRLMNEVVAQHPGNPEARTQKAQLLLQQGKVEEGEAALEEAFKIQPNFPHGLFLRALLRFQEGELVGALMLARKATEAYAPEALDQLADVYRLIFECEMRLQRPVAARAALQQRVHCAPGEEAVRQEFDAFFGDQGRLPACVRREYRLRAPDIGVAGPRRKAWDQVLAAARGPHLSELARAFAQLTQQDATDAAAWFNLALARAWLGDNRAALEALEHYLPLEDNDAAAEEAAALAEVLRAGASMEEQSDYLNYALVFQASDLAPLSHLLEQWNKARRLIVPPTERQDLFFALVLEGQSTALLTASTGTELTPLAGYVTIHAGIVQFVGPREEGILKLREELAQKLSPNLGQLPIRRTPLPFHDVLTEALIFPNGPPDALTAQRARAHSKQLLRGDLAHTSPSSPARPDAARGGHAADGAQASAGCHTLPAGLRARGHAQRLPL